MPLKNRALNLDFLQTLKGAIALFRYPTHEENWENPLTQWRSELGVKLVDKYVP